PELSEPSALAAKVRQACAEITENSTDFRVRLSQLRQQLSSVSDTDLNATLIALQQQGQLSLRPMEDPQEISDADEQAAIDMGGGDKRYFALLKD
ncbi:MAG: hypothetical protein AAFQ61_12180, partial [Cyanobacteria bacterium J06626_23]